MDMLGWLLALIVAAQTLSLELVADGFRLPTQVTHADEGSGRLFVVEQAGRVLIIDAGGRLSEPFLDIRSLVGSAELEQGLLGLAFHPRFSENGWFYVNYTDLRGDTVIARYPVSIDRNRADPESAEVILTIAQPAANHNGGLLLFGPDGMLWIGTGDGGGPGAELPRAQDMGSLLGKMLRIDVDSAFPYAVPPDNPYLDVEGVRPEIWGHGLRNPWRYAFHPATGELFIADVGQDRYEWVHVVPSDSGGGYNFGWPIAEGLHCQPAEVACDRSPLVNPVAEYDHGQGCGIVGGYVYRGVQAPSVRGDYLFSDYCSGRIWKLGRSNDDWAVEQLAATGLAVSSFGEDGAGELYLAAIGQGAIYRLGWSA